MDKDIAKELVEKYVSGTCTAEEKAIVESWYLDAVLKASDGDLPEPDYAMAEARLNEILPVVPRKVKFPVYRYAGIAAAVAMVVFGVWFFNYRGEILRDALDDKSVVVNDIAPGKNGATLTLADGKVIQLSDTKTGVVIGDDKLVYNDNTVISSIARDLPSVSSRRARFLNSTNKRSLGTRDDGMGTMTAETQKGQTYEFTLPDGTKVWLNAASKLHVPSGFSGTETRKVELSGEAYFEVFKDKKRPFIVESNGQEVTVLGTHFNISAYKDEGSTKTTLLEGSVSVRHLDDRRDLLNSTDKRSLGALEMTAKGKNGVVLKPNQQAILASNSKITVKEIDPKETMAWKDGYFRFNDEKIESIMRKVSRWYNVDVEYQGEITKEGFNGAITRYSSIRDVLEIMEGSKAVHFKIEGRRIIVSK